MKALLDTHTFLWWNIDDTRLSETAREVIGDGNNELYLSAVSAWEIAIKSGRGSLILPESPDQYVTSRLQLHSLLPLSIHFSHVLHVFSLPDIHRDPFDRLLVAQSQLERLPLLTADATLNHYDVDVIW